MSDTEAHAGPPREPSTGSEPAADLLAGPPRIINVGLEAFSEEPRRLGTPVIQVDWAPPAGGDPHLMALLARLGDDA